LDLEAARRRDLIDEDHRIASDARRTRSLLEDRNRREASEAAAEAVRREAEEQSRGTIDRAASEAAALVSKARAHVEQLTSLREQIVADLATIRARLEPIPGRLEDIPPLPADPLLDESRRDDRRLSSTDG
ncbi:hypothetical protein G6026_02735, partial [Dietzia sp. DQ11-38-2]|nr:hypothetical protein [Dietzia sp. DQ11-38-2]